MWYPTVPQSVDVVVACLHAWPLRPQETLNGNAAQYDVALYLPYTRLCHIKGWIQTECRLVELPRSDPVLLQGNACTDSEQTIVFKGVVVAIISGLDQNY